MLIALRALGQARAVARRGSLSAWLVDRAAPVAVPSQFPEPEVRSAFRLLAGASRLPGGLWRNTCLYRAVVECGVLRARGIRSHVALGVARDAGSDVVAHAWAVAEGHITVTERATAVDRYRVLVAGSIDATGASV